MRTAICFGLVPILITLCTSLSFAEFNISSGISIMEEYNDNIFLDSVYEEDDFISTVSPNITFSYSPGKALDLSLYYGLNFRFYNRHSQLNDEDIDDVQYISGNARIKPSNIIYIDIVDTFQKMPIDIRRISSIDNYHKNMTNINLFTASPNIILPVTDTISATIGYTYTNTWYNDPSSVGSDAHSALLTLDKKFSPRINGAVQYEYYAYRPDLNGEGSNVAIADYDSHEASAEIHYQITESVTIYGELGEVWFNYQAVDEIGEFYWKIGTETDNLFKITENTSVGFNFGIEFIDSPASGTYRSQMATLHFETGNVLKFEVDPYYYESTYLTSDRKDRFIGVTFALSRPLSRKINVFMDGRVDNNDFLSENEDARLYSVGCNLDYRLNRRMNISMGYRYSRQDASSDISNEELEINDYENNIGWLQASLTF